MVWTVHILLHALQMFVSLFHMDQLHNIISVSLLNPPTVTFYKDMSGQNIKDSQGMANFQGR